MVVDIEGVVKLLFPETNGLPPVAFAYQSITAPLKVADIVNVPVPHLELFVPAGAMGTRLTVAVTVLLEVETQPVPIFLTSA